jgi:hypothetical protein
VITSALYRASLQCELRAWLRLREPSVLESPNRAALAELRALLPRRLRQPGVRFGERIEHLDVSGVVDVLEPLPGGALRIGQARATTQVRAHDLDTLVLPYWALRERGVRVERAEIFYLSPDYVRGAGPLDVSALVLARDVRDELEFLAGDVGAELHRLRAGLAAAAAPEVEPSPHCHRPRTCEFHERCTAGWPDDAIGRLPGLGPASHAALRERGVSTIAAIPEDFPLAPRQARARLAHRGAGLVVDPALALGLLGTGPPADYLDFETWTPTIPPYPGTRALQPIAMQWSLHRLDTRGELSHRHFLAEERGDPRCAFARSLLAALGESDAPVLVYSSAESEMLEELARALPEQRAALRAVRSRLVDVLRLVRDHVYHREFRGSFRLKRVAAALAPGFGWDDLGAVREGLDAARALACLAVGPLAPGEAATLRAALLAYCERDTLALVHVHGALRALASLGAGAAQGSAIE